MDPIFVYIISLIALLYIFAPLFFSRKSFMPVDRSPAASEITRVHQLGEKLEQMVAEKEDLEFEHEMGKLSDEDFSRLLEDNTSEIEELTKVIGAHKVKQAADEEIEKNILQKRKLK